MNPLTSSAIAALVRQGIAGRAQAAVGRLTLPLICGLIALQFTLVAIGLLAVVFWNLLLPSIGPVWTPVALAGGFLALAGIAVSVIMSHRKKRRAERSRSSDVDTLIEPMLAEARRFTRDNQGASLLAAIVAGVAAGIAARD